MIPVFRPSYDGAEEQAVIQTLRSGWVGLGPRTEEFEKKFAQYVKSAYGVSTNSCTAALHMALRLLNVKDGDEVIVPALTFVSTAHAVCYVGAKPVFADVNEDTLVLDWQDALNKITRRTKAIICVQYAGWPDSGIPAGFDEVPVIYDCAHSAGSSFDASGKLCCWSFHAVKNLACGDGGMLTFDKQEWNRKAQAMRWLGIDKSTWNRAKNPEGYSWDYNVEDIGYKYHGNDILSSIGLVQLEKLPAMQRKRHELVARYMGGLSGLVDLPPYDPGCGYHLFVVRSNPRNSLSDYLKNKGISTSVHYKPIHKYPCYKESVRLPVTERVYKEILTLPLYPDLELKAVDGICAAIKEFTK